MFKYIFLILASLCLQWGYSQNVISGSVQDARNNSPLNGAHVFVGGTAEGVVTDQNGEFSLLIYSDENELEVSYPGYESKTVEVAPGDTLLTILLEPLSLGVDTVLTFDPETYEEQVQVVSYERPRDPSSYQNNYNNAYLEPPYWNTEDYSLIEENNEKKTLETPLSTFSIDVDRASYANVRRFTEEGRRPPVDAVRIEEMINYFQYEYPSPKKGLPFSANTELSDCPWNPERKLLHIGLQGEQTKHKKLPPSNLVFLIDVSGSMSSPNKLPLLKSAFELLVAQLRPKDRVAIVVYASASGLVLASRSGRDKAEILSAIQNLRAGGSTAGGEGIQLAYQVAKEHFLENGNNRVILATDGDFNVGVSSDAELTRLIEEKREDGIFLTVLGFGTGNYKDNKMELLADKGNGNYAYIDKIQEANKIFGTELLGTLYTIAKDVKIQLEFNPYYVESYRLVGYENRVLEQEDFSDDKKDAGELGVGHSVTALYEIKLADPATAQNSLQTGQNLRYQKNAFTNYATKNEEIASLSLRYKLPDEDTSQLLNQSIGLHSLPFAKSSENFRFSAAVAGFGLLLRESSHNQALDFEKVTELATGAMGEDSEGIRQEFVNLVKKQAQFSQ